MGVNGTKGNDVSVRTHSVTTFECVSCDVASIEDSRVEGEGVMEVTTHLRIGNDNLLVTRHELSKLRDLLDAYLG